ncbi:unnamed protein product [Rhizoctonia solani]|uniref:NACHT domain-containing protein n=1 Tax=Rhizoctonia solani TaxID=456999 RepID=A0A8H3ADA9_9AGAM|nr:unnamed protein product [Rhizoctonia solani]
MAVRRKLDQFKSKFKRKATQVSQSSAHSSSTPLGSSLVNPSATTTWAHLNTFTRILNQAPTMFGPLRIVVGDLMGLVGSHERISAGQKECDAIKSQLESLFHDLSHIFSGKGPPAMTASMEALCVAVSKELGFVRNRQAQGSLTRHLDSGKDAEDITQCYRRIQSHFERLKLNVDLNLWIVVDEQSTENRLKGMQPALSAHYNSVEAASLRRRECTPNTRKQLLLELAEWRKKVDGKIFWLNGMAGTGKTTIVANFCSLLDRSSKLGASFFCTRLLPECRGVKHIIPTIAYQLARFSRPFRFALSQVLEHDADIHTRALRYQFERMIFEPLRQVASTLPEDVVVVIDALDECDDPNGVEKILQVLLSFSSKIPIKFFVSSRPEPQIRDWVGDLEYQIALHKLDDNIVKEDIATYLQAELANITLSTNQFLTLVDRAGKLFIYAATVVRYLTSSSAFSTTELLEIVLSATMSPLSNRDKEMDSLYSTILAAAFENPELEPWERERMKLVLDTVVCAREPLTLYALNGLLKFNDVQIVHASLRPFWSVLHISGTDDSVKMLHASFPEYMLDPLRSKEYGCDLQTHNGNLVELCFERIKINMPQFNICALESSYVPDDQVSDLEARLQRAIPADLAYVCQYWEAHLELTGGPEGREGLLFDFLSQHLLLWMEVLNLKKRINEAVTMLDLSRKWCNKHSCPPELSALAHDAWRFVTMFAANPISGYTPHIYVSLLASWPAWGPVAEHYVPRTKGLVNLTGTGILKRQMASLGAFQVGSDVISVAFPPDGTRLVSGSRDKAIRVWDIRNGYVLLGPLKGHSRPVNSVAFSPDGKRFVSGSDDRTLLVWDVQTGRRILGPLKGHTNRVNSVSFSSEGLYVASGSDDNAIRLWDTQSGEPAFPSVSGHSGGVNSVTFSPDNTYIASASMDSTIRIWDFKTQNAQPNFKVLNGHTKSVNSISFSNDGKLLVSGSSDASVRVWDVDNGHTVIGPLQGRFRPVNSVSFSPNGESFISGSDDYHIRGWEVHTGQMIIGPLSGHTGQVRAVAFSPDGSQIVSGSHDSTLRTWDAKAAKIPSNLPGGHDGPVVSVAFSCDGTRIVSSGSDRTARVWDPHTGEMIIGPLTTGLACIHSAALSPDNSHIATGSDQGFVEIWDAQKLDMVLRLLPRFVWAVTTVKFSHDGRLIVASSRDGTIKAWDVHDGKLIFGPLEGHVGFIHSIDISPNDEQLVSSASGDTGIRVWDMRNGHLLRILEGHLGAVMFVKFSPDGTRIASCSRDATLRLWDTESGQAIGDPFKGHTKIVLCVVFSPDGTRLLSAGHDNTICMWDSQKGKIILGPLRAHTNYVMRVAFSPDGVHFVSGSEDKVIRVWDVGREWKGVLEGADSIASCAASSTQNAISSFPFRPQVTSWDIDNDGWVVDNMSRRLLWIPLDIRPILLHPLNTLLLSTRGSIQLDFSNALMGESWVECYTPSMFE